MFVENPDRYQQHVGRTQEGRRDPCSPGSPPRRYYLGVTGRLCQHGRARLIGTGFNYTGVPENYSPTSFLINTLLPADNKNRTMDYVATIMIE